MLSLPSSSTQKTNSDFKNKKPQTAWISQAAKNHLAQIQGKDFQLAF